MHLLGSSERRICTKGEIKRTSHHYAFAMASSWDPTTLAGNSLETKEPRKCPNSTIFTFQFHLNPPVFWNFLPKLDPIYFFFARNRPQNSRKWILFSRRAETCAFWGVRRNPYAQTERSGGHLTTMHLRWPQVEAPPGWKETLSRR